MPQADGTILIDTEINADGMKAGSKEVEAAVRRMAASVNDLGTKAKTALNKQVDAFSRLNNEFAAQRKKVDELKKKVSEYGNQKIPTSEYKEIQNHIDSATKRMNDLIAAQEKFVAMGGSENSKQYKRYQYDIDELANTIKYAKGELQDLEEKGQAFTFGSKTKEAAADMERLESAERKLANLNDRLGTSYSSIKGQVNDYKKRLLQTDSAQKKASKSGNRLSKSLSSTGKAAKSAQFGLGKMLVTSLLFSFVFRAISAATQAIKDGFTNLAQYSGTTNNSISMLWSSLERLKNSLATAFAPILDVIAPILSKFIDMISTAASYVSMFFAFLSGKSTYTRAVAVQKDYAASLQDTAGSAEDLADSTKDDADATKEATEEAERYLSPLDDINKFSKENAEISSPSTGGSSGKPGSAGNAGIGNEGPLFEEVAITDIPILEKLKDILSKIFQPFKEAWEQEGQATIDAAKYAFSSLASLAKSVGNSLLEVWTNGTGTKMVSTILQIFQGILTTIGNIAGRLNKAWNTNKVGTAIIQAIADIFQIILDFINKIVWATADWAAQIDFYPLLESVKNLLESLQPIIQTIGDFLYDIYTTIILPILTWLIETALPFLINAVSEFFNFLGENKEIIEIVGAALIGAFAASKIVPLISTIIGAVKGIISIFTGAGGFLGAISSIVSALGGPLTLAIMGIIAVGILLITHWEEISETAKIVWEFVKKKFKEFDDFLQNVFQKDWTESFGVIGDIFNAFFKNVENIWNSIKTIFNGIIDFVEGIFSGDWKRAWEGIKTILKGIWDGMVAVVKAPINIIIGAINGLIRGVVGGLNIVIDALNKLHFETPDWLPFGLGGKSFGFNIGRLSTPQIPYLASGAVIPPNKEFMAVLGDQTHGNNIEAPESLIRKIVREESGGSGNKYEVVAKVGRKELFRMMIDEAKMQRVQTGRNPFELA